jgi:hypothetical protein
LETIYRDPSDKDQGITEWRRRERAAKAQLAEDELKRRRGELVLREDHDARFTTACADLRNTMLSWASRLFPNDDDNRARLRAEVHRLLESFTRHKRLIENPKIKKTKKKVSKSQKEKSK